MNVTDCAHIEYYVIMMNHGDSRNKPKKKLIVPKRRLNGDPLRRTHINLDISSKIELTCIINSNYV